VARRHSDQRVDSPVLLARSRSDSPLARDESLCATVGEMFAVPSAERLALSCVDPKERSD
jgi:hypothetical protein